MNTNQPTKKTTWRIITDPLIIGLIAGAATVPAQWLIAKTITSITGIPKNTSNTIARWTLTGILIAMIIIALIIKKAKKKI